MLVLDKNFSHFLEVLTLLLQGTAMISHYSWRRGSLSTLKFWRIITDPQKEYWEIVAVPCKSNVKASKKWENIFSRTSTKISNYMEEIWECLGQTVYQKFRWDIFVSCYEAYTNLIRIIVINLEISIISGCLVVMVETRYCNSCTLHLLFYLRYDSPINSYTERSSGNISCAAHQKYDRIH